MLVQILPLQETVDLQIGLKNYDPHKDFMSADNLKKLNTDKRR